MFIMDATHKQKVKCHQEKKSSSDNGKNFLSGWWSTRIDYLTCSERPLRGKQELKWHGRADPIKT